MTKKAIYHGNSGAVQILFLTIWLLLVAGTPLQAQITWAKQTLTRGRLWSTLWNSFQYGDPTETENAFYTLDYPGYSKAADLSDALNYCEAAGYTIYGVRDGMAGAYSINSRYFPSGTFVFPTEETLLTRNYNFRDPFMAGEEIVTGGHHVNVLNLDVSRRSMVWSIPKYNSFIIHEVMITNMDFSTVDSLYYGQRYGIRVTQRSGSRGDEKYGWHREGGYFYFYDHQQFRFQDEVPVEWTFGVGPQRGDIGDARDIYARGSLEHELDAPGYITAVVLDSASGRVFQNILEHTGQGVTEGALEPDIMFTQEVSLPSRFKQVMTHEQPHLSWDEARAAGGEGGNKYERRPEFLVSVGPFTLPAFATIKVVFAEVIGEMEREKIVAGGIDNIDRLAVESLAALHANVLAARELYANHYMPDHFPPPTPTDGENSLTLLTNPGTITIEFPPVPESYIDPLTGVNDFAGYRIYRSTYFTIGPWTLLADLPRSAVTLTDGKVRYVDETLQYGVGAYYCVTTYDSDGNESGKVNNNRFPVYAQMPINDQFPEQVYVVPNPFRQHSRLTGTGERYRLEFTSVPPKCRISIYTLFGELVKEIEHDDGSGSTAWGSIVQADYAQ